MVLLGLTSMFTDISSEMLTAVVPLYFLLELGATPLQFGLVDGLYQVVSVLVRIGSGVWADVRRRYKETAVAGYALSALCKAGLVAVGAAWLPVALLLMVDRLGKGIRTAPRDALIALSSQRAHLGEAFGAHRAMDTIGAVTGPLLAFVVLALAPGSYDSVFVVSLAFGVIGVAVIALFVENRRGDTPPAVGATAIALRERTALGRTLATAGLRPTLAAGAALGALTASDAMIYLFLQRQGAVPPALFPLLFVGTSLMYLLLALPVGRLADRAGRHRLFVVGHLAVVAIYALLLTYPVMSMAVVLTCLALLGLYYAATDGVLAALASSVLGTDQIGTGLALTGTVWVVSRASGAVLFGALWNAVGPSAALGVFGVGLVISIVAASWLLRIRHAWPPDRGGW